jgi:hypothetical protein
MATTKNPEAKPINQKQGPRTGNAGTPSKRNEFKSVKSTTGSERSKLADFVMNAVANRGEHTRSSINPGLENLSANSAKTTGIKRNSTADGAKLPAKYKTPKTKG